MGKAKSGGETKSETTRKVVGNVCTCDTISRGGGGGGTYSPGGHYWHPN